MNRATRVCVISAKGLSEEKLYEEYKDYCPKGFKLRPYTGELLELTFEPDSPKLKEYLELLKANKVNPELFNVVSHTAKELREAPFFEINVDYPLELEGTDSSKYGTKHTGGCPKCGLGKRPDGDVLVDRKFMKKTEFGWLEPELYVSERLLEIFEESNISGFTVGSVVKDYKGRDMAPFYVLEVNSILPPMNDTTWLEPTDKICDLCRLPKTIYKRSDAQYDREKLRAAKDINFSCEFINNFHTPILIVSAKLRNLLKEHKVKTYKNRPVTIID